METVFRSVTLIEDDPGHAMIIRRAMKGYAQDIAHFANFMGAWKSFSAALPDVVISDLHLPDTKGLEHVDRILKTYPHLPVIVLTSSSALGDAVEAMRYGAQDYIVKNFDQNFSQILGFSLSRVFAAQAMAAERRRLEREMVALRRAIESSDDGLAVVDSDATIAYANAGFLRLIAGWSGEVNSLSQIFSDQVIKHHGLCDNLMQQWREGRAGKVWQTEFGLVAQRDRAFLLTMSFVEALEGQTMGRAVIWIRDISEQKRRERFQREILSTTTHDLKGPLGAIAISSELLTDLVKDVPNRKAAELVIRIASSAQGALNLIDEFLSARRIQEGTFILRPSEVDLSAAIHEAVAGFESVAQARGITFQLPSAKQPHLGCVDKIGFMRVVGNLVSNALKFTPRGGTVSISLGSQDQEDSVTVADTGSGMEPAELSTIFDRFSRLDRHREVGGSGLGLFVVRSIVSAHGGIVDVSSALGHGTQFCVSFPKSPPANERGELISLAFS